MSIGHTPNRAEFPHPATKSVPIYPLSKICAPWKSGSKFTKIPWDPVILPNFIAVGQTMYEKSVTIFTPFTILAPQGTLWAKIHQSGWWCIARKLPNLVPSDNHCTRYLLPKFVDFVDGVTYRRKTTRMWANVQRDGRRAEHRWRPLFNAAKFGWRPLLDCRAVTLPRRESRWN